MRFAFLLLASCACFVARAHAQLTPVSPQSATTSAAELGSPAIDAGDYVYVSGQGPLRAGSSVAKEFPEQVRQSLDNIKTIVETAGLNMNHVVYVQVFLENIKHCDELNEVFSSYFPKDPPARAILGVVRVPGPAVQISAVAVRDLKGKQTVMVPGWKVSKAYSAGILTNDRLFVSSMFGSDPATGKVPADPLTQVNLALDGMKSVAQAAGLSLANMVFVNPYLTADFPMRIMNQEYAKRFEFGNTPARATIEVASLPDGARISYTGVAVRDLNQRRAIRPKNMAPSPTASPCVFAGDTLYCSAKSGFIPGPNGGIYAESTADQTRQTMRNLLDNLEEAGMNFDQVVSTTIYLDDLSEWPLFANVYKKYFDGTMPAWTTVQQITAGDRKPDKEGHYPTLEQFSLIAVRNRTAVK